MATATPGDALPCLGGRGLPGLVVGEPGWCLFNRKRLGALWWVFVLNMGLTGGRAAS